MIEPGPKTLDELISLVPGVAKFRSMNCDLLRKLLGRQAKQCTNCGNVVPKNRRTWCSAVCEQELLPRINPQFMVGLVERRDKGICQICGRDTKLCERVWRHYWRDTIQRTGYRENVATSEVAKLLGHGRGAWREIDHTIPVCEGGGLCKPDGLRTVCGQCHLAETNRLAKRRK